MTVPGPQRALTRDDLAAHIAEHVFGAAVDDDITGGERNAFGIELEFLTGTSGFTRLRPEVVDEAARDLVGIVTNGRFTVEPGGQFELSTRPAAGAKSWQRARSSSARSRSAAARCRSARAASISSVRKPSRS